MELHDPGEGALPGRVGGADPEPVAGVLGQLVHAVGDAQSAVDRLEPERGRRKTSSKVGQRLFIIN